MEELALNVMDHEQAVQWKAQLGQTANHLRALLWEGYHGKAHIALGYPNWTDCIVGIGQELDLSSAHLWRLHSANLIEAQLAPGSVGAIPERHLRPLRRLKPEQKQEVWQSVQRTAKGKEITAAQVERIVKRLHPPKTKRPAVFSMTEHERLKHRLLNILGFLPPSVEWTLWQDIWRMVSAATAEYPEVRQMLERARPSSMTDLGLSTEDDAEQVERADDEDSN